MCPACLSSGAPASPGGRTLDSASCKAHPLLLHAMQVNPCSPDWSSHLAPPVAIESCLAEPLQACASQKQKPYPDGQLTCLSLPLAPLDIPIR